MMRNKLMALALVLVPALPAAADNTVRAVFEGDLSIVDPHATTTYITRNLANLVYDTPIARGSSNEIKPQMLKSWTTSDDGMTYTFILRDGLQFHDGSPVRAKDVALSIKRWASRAWAGTLLLQHTQSIDTIDDKTFTLKLSKPFAHVIRILSLGIHVMPERLAITDPATPLKEVMGSGPFKMNMADWVPGSKLRLTKNENYKSRDDAPDGLAGAKKVNIDALELRFISDQETRFNALSQKEIDFVLAPSIDYLPLVAGTPDLVIDGMEGRLGKLGVIVMNQAQAPFNDAKVRKAVQYALNSAEIMTALGLPPEFALPDCRSIFSCGKTSPFETSAGVGDLIKTNVEKAKALLAESGYKGEPIVGLHTTNIRNFDIASTVIEEQLRRVGFNVKATPVEWNTLVSKASSKEPVSNGGWSYFAMHSDTPDLTDPLTNSYMNRNCATFLSGFFCNENITKLRDKLLGASNDKEFRSASEELQKEFATSANMIIWGQYTVPAMYRSSLKGLQKAGLPLFWDVKKTD